jgi:N-acetylmuramoyl-L-alanine amidase
MNYRMLGTIVTVACLLAPRQALAETARDMYTRAMAQERVVRDEANKPTLPQMRRAVALYESLVRRHPTSGYCDNALWQGANLASLAHERFGDDADRRTAARLLALLKTEYPSSKLLAQANTMLAAVPPAPVSKPTPGSDLDSRSAPPVPPVPALSPSASIRKSRSDPGVSDVTVMTLRDVKRTVLPDGVRLTVEIDGETAYHQEEIANPRRLFFDFRNVKAAPALQDTSLKFDGDLVKEVRLGRHPQNTTRVVVDLEGVAGYTVYPLYGPYRLVVDLQRTAGPATAAIAERLAPVKTLGPPADPPPPIVQASAGAPALPWTSVSRPSPPPAATTTTSVPPAAKDPLPSKPAPASLPPAAPAANSNGKFSLSRQLGLGVSRVVVDAGHGGHDPGAHGNGVNEAELTLDVALRLQKLLEKADVEVVMTRDTDVFIPLEERTAIANREGADLFLSIHANASRNVQARGVETYFLNFATNPEAEAVAARENATSGKPMHSLPDIVKAIALNNKINESRDLAGTVQKAMVKRLAARNRSLRDLGVKQAPFVVLIGASMPSVLAEVSFVTNKQDGTLLKTPAYRQQIAQALMDAVVNYQQSLKRMSGIAAKKTTTQ